MSQDQEQAQSRLSQLQAIDPALLQEVVRQDQRSRDFQVTNWTVDRLSNQGMMNGDGLFLFSGTGRSGHEQQSWSVVLKIINAPTEELDPRSLRYWKRELLLAESGVLAQLAGPFVPACTYGTVDFGMSCGVWMEHVVEDAPRHWTLTEYAFAARQIGRAQAAQLVGPPVPDLPWMAQDHARAFAIGNFQQQFLEDQFVLDALGEGLVNRLCAVWDDRERFFAALSRITKVFSHGDANRRNLFIRRRNGNDELVAVDWELAGYHPLGEEISNLVLFTTFLHEWPPTSAAKLEATVYPSYMAGLCAGGWSGNPDEVRLGFTAATAQTLGLSIPLCIAVFGKEEMREHDLQKFGHTPQELVPGYVALAEYAVALAGEARRIMDRMGW